MIYFIIAIISILLHVLYAPKICMPAWLFIFAGTASLYFIYTRAQNLFKSTQVQSKKLDLYRSMRTQIQKGDLLAFEGKDFFARIIRWAGKNTPYSHVGLAFLTEHHDESFRVYILESVTDKGVSIVPLSKKLASYKGRAWWFRLDSTKVTDKQRDVVQQFAMLNLGETYDFGGIVKLGLKYIHDLFKLKRGLHVYDDIGQAICSELAAKAYKAGALIAPKIETGFMQPYEVAALPIFEKARQIL